MLVVLEGAEVVVVLPFEEVAVTPPVWVELSADDVGDAEATVVSEEVGLALVPTGAGAAVEPVEAELEPVPAGADAMVPEDEVLIPLIVEAKPES